MYNVSSIFRLHSNVTSSSVPLGVVAVMTARPLWLSVTVPVAATEAIAGKSDASMN